MALGCLTGEHYACKPSLFYNIIMLRGHPMQKRMIILIGRLLDLLWF